MCEHYCDCAAPTRVAMTRFVAGKSVLTPMCVSRLASRLSVFLGDGDPTYAVNVLRRRPRVVIESQAVHDMSELISAARAAGIDVVVTDCLDLCDTATAAA
jgi:hypothetical protein